jgi:cytochrome c-type biogenesis protein CcmH
MKPLLAGLVLALLVPATALASEPRPTQAEVERELVCPVCKPATLDQSDSEIARRMKREIARRIAAGDTKSEIKDYLVAQFGEQVLAAPPRSGFNWLAWLLPLAGLGLGAAAIGAAAWRWTRAREPAFEQPSPGQNGRPQIDPELNRRLEEELARFE